MHSRYSTIFGIESLQLNRHFRTQPKQPEPQQSMQAATELTLDANLYQDLQWAFAPLEINQVVQKEQMDWQDGILFLPNNQLLADEKRRLWQLMSNHLDNL